ncbi:MAG: HEAT repeat domain-containing protein [Bacteroidota bacterium]
MNMEKDKIIELWQDKLSGEISDENEKILTKLLSKNHKWTQELQEMEHTWHLFDKIERPEPSPLMDAKFEGMLAAHLQKKESKTSLLDTIRFHVLRGWQVGIATFIVGLFLGWWLLPLQDQKQDIHQLSHEIQSIKEMMMLTLIEQPKAQERIRAVHLAAELPQADEKVIHALITTLNYDVNVNVRLASLESLLSYSELAEVRQALINALEMQESALMQVAIADALVQIQEKSSLETMKNVKENVEDEMVRQKLEQSIQSLQQS